MMMILLWIGALALSILMYVLLDGFDLGVGMLFGFAKDDHERSSLLAAISPVWDGNETWLVMNAAALFGAFPKAYGALLGAFYLPVMFLLGSLILRGVAFEFRARAVKMRWLWDCSFVGGSTLASFLQGTMVGALVHGLPFENGLYTGGGWTWLSPFSLLCGVGLCLGYALLGAAWAVGKLEGEPRERAYGKLLPLLGAVLVFLAVVFVYALHDDLQIMHRWIDRPYLIVFPILGTLAAIGLGTSAVRRWDRLAFPIAASIFLAAFATLGASFWPYMIPFAITAQEAASPPESLSFMFWGAGLFVLPMVLIYTVTAYRVFRGKVAPQAVYGGADG